MGTLVTLSSRYPSFLRDLSRLKAKACQNNRLIMALTAKVITTLRIMMVATRIQTRIRMDHQAGTTISPHLLVVGFTLQ